MLSVVVPTLNRPEVAAQAVADAFAQLPRDGELVVVDEKAALMKKLGQTWCRPSAPDCAACAACSLCATGLART